MSERFQFKKGEKITVLTGYDEHDSTLLNEAGIDIILVGDSIGNTRLGYPNTTYVSIQDMVTAVEAVKRANTVCFIVSDLPYNTYNTKSDAELNAKKLISAGADAVKLEGGSEIAEIANHLCCLGIPVMGHIGHTPQTDEKPIVQGKNKEDEFKLINDAKALEAVGVFSIVIELVVSEVSKRITKSVKIPTIGIGAGPHTDGQVLVIDDLLDKTDYSKFPKGKPKFIGTWNGTPIQRVTQFKIKVKLKTFPSKKELY